MQLPAEPGAATAAQVPGGAWAFIGYDPDGMRLGGMGWVGKGRSLEFEGIVVDCRSQTKEARSYQGVSKVKGLLSINLIGLVFGQISELSDDFACEDGADDGTVRQRRGGCH